jgi:hypothetical protein
MERQYIVKDGKRILVHAGATLAERKGKYAYCKNHGLTRDEARRLMDWPWSKIDAYIARKNKEKQG